MREALGPEAQIRVDANAAWDLETAKRTLAELEPFGIELAEQPVATLERGGRAGARRPRSRSPATRASRRRADALRAARTGRLRLTGVKLSKVGGPEAALEIAGYLPAYVSSALDGPVGIAAAAQVAETLRDAAVAGERPSSPTASPPSASSPRRSPRSSASCATACSTRPPGPASASRSTRTALQAHRL